MQVLGQPLTLASALVDNICDTFGNPAPQSLGGSSYGLRSEVWGHCVTQTSPGHMRHPTLFCSWRCSWFETQKNQKVSRIISLFLPPTPTPLIYQEINFEWMNKQRWEFRPISTLPTNIPYTPSNKELRYASGSGQSRGDAQKASPKPLPGNSRQNGSMWFFYSLGTELSFL